MSSPSSKPQGGGRILLLAGEGQSSREEPAERLLPGHLILTKRELEHRAPPLPTFCNSLNVRQAGNVSQTLRHCHTCTCAHTLVPLLKPGMVPACPTQLHPPGQAGSVETCSALSGTPTPCSSQSPCPQLSTHTHAHPDTSTSHCIPPLMFPVPIPGQSWAGC